MTAPKRINREITIVRGDLYQDDITVEDDTTIYSFAASMSLAGGASVSNFGVTVVGKVVTITLQPAVTAALVLKPYHWRFNRVNSTLQTETMIYGTVHIVDY
jgi:hypothetical protein